MLDAEAPGLLLWSLIQTSNRDIGQRLPQHRGRALPIPDGCLNSKRKWIAQEFQRKPGLGRDVVYTVGHRIVSEEAAADGIADDAEVGWIVVHAVAAAQGGAAQQLIRETEPRANFAPVGVELGPGISVDTHVFHRAVQIQSGDRDGRLRGWIEITHLVVALGARGFDIVAESKVQCQFLSDAPVVLQESANLVTLRGGERGDFVFGEGVVDVADHQSGQCVAAHARRPGRRAAAGEGKETVGCAACRKLIRWRRSSPPALISCLPMT